MQLESLFSYGLLKSDFLFIISDLFLCSKSIITSIIFEIKNPWFGCVSINEKLQKVKYKVSEKWSKTNNSAKCSKNYIRGFKRLFDIRKDQLHENILTRNNQFLTKKVLIRKCYLQNGAKKLRWVIMRFVRFEIKQ